MKNQKLYLNLYYSCIFFLFFQATLLCNESVALKETDARSNAYFLLGCYFYHNQNYDKAQKNLEQSLQINPDSDYIKLRLAQTLIYLKNTEEAFKILLPLSEKETAYACEADVILASICLENKKEMTAISFLNHALSLNPKNDNIFIALSKLYEQLDLLSEAIQTNIKATESFPENIYFFIKTGELCLINKEYKKAIPFYETAFLKKENEMKILLGLALCYKNINEHEKAIQFFDKALKIDPLNINIYEEIIKIKASLKKWEESFSLCENLISIAPKNLNGFKLYGYLCINSNKIEKGIKLFEKHKENFSQAGDFWFWLARFYDIQNDVSAAENNFIKAVKFSERKDKPRFFYALFLHKNKRTEEAISQLIETINESPNHAGALNFLGYLYIESSKPLNEAIVFIERALLINPDNPAFLDSLGWALYKKGNYKEALIYQERARALNPSQIILKHLYEIYIALRENQKAIAVSALLEEEINKKTPSTQNKINHEN